MANDVLDKFYFRNGKGDLFHAAFSYDPYPDNPIDNEFAFGSFVFDDFSKSRIGHEQVSDVKELIVSRVFPKEAKIRQDFTLTLPVIDKESGLIAGVPEDSPVYRMVAGNGESGYRFNTELCVQLLEDIINSFGDFDVGVFSSGGDKVWMSVDVDTDSVEESPELSAVNDALGYLRDEFGFYFSKSDEKVLEADDLDAAYREWSKDYAAVVPLRYEDHGSNGCKVHVLSDDSIDRMNGFAYVEKSNPEVIDYLKNHSEKETSEWARRYLESEAREYGLYLNGDCYSMDISDFNPLTLSFGEPERHSSILIGDMDFDGYIFSEFGKFERVPEQEVSRLCHTMTSAYKENMFNNFLDEVRSSLPDFNGDPLAASCGVLYSVKKNPSHPLQEQALKEAMKERGCVSEAATRKVIRNCLGIKPFEFSFDRKDGCRHVVYLDKNKNSSAYNTIAGGLAINEREKTFCLYNARYVAPYAMTDRKDVELDTRKNIVKLAKTLKGAGFSESRHADAALRPYVQKLSDLLGRDGRS